MIIDIPILHREYSKDLFITIPNEAENELQKAIKVTVIDIDLYKISIKPSLRIRIWIGLKRFFRLL